MIPTRLDRPPWRDVRMTSELAPIPGGWSVERIVLAERVLRVTRPADPDAFLDDPATIAEHQASDYMPYWPYLWPAAYRMAELVAGADWPADHHVAAALDGCAAAHPSGAAAASGGTEAGSFRHAVLEIGSGIGLVGMAALLRGDRVTFSDNRPEAVALSLYNAHRNGLQLCRGELLDWNNPQRHTAGGHAPENCLALDHRPSSLDALYDVILGSEVIYERKNHEPILNLVGAMLRPDGVCWLGDAGRHQAHLFTADALQRGFHVTLFNSDGQVVPDHDAGQFRLIELCRPV